MLSFVKVCNKNAVPLEIAQSAGAKKMETISKPLDGGGGGVIGGLEDAMVVVF